MKHYRAFTFCACAVALTLLPMAARADKPAAAGGKPGDPPGNARDHAGQPDHAKSNTDRSNERGDHGKPGDDADSHAGGKPGAHRGDGFRSAMRRLQEDIKAGRVKKEELKNKLAKLRESAGERGKDHRQELSRRWGGVLAMPPVREELRKHARRMAFLSRAMVLAETEAKDKQKLTERISMLIDKENERHERAMEHFKSLPAPSAASASPASSNAPAAAASAQGASK